MVKIGILYDCSSHGDDDNFCEQASAIKWIGLKDGNIRYLCTCKQPFDDPLIGTPCTSLQKNVSDASNPISRRNLGGPHTDIPPMLGLGLLLIVPWIFLFVATTYESYKSKVDLEISIFKRYTAYYVAYVIITSITVALSSLLAIDSLAGVTTFVTLITQKVFRGEGGGTKRMLGYLSPRKD